MGLLLFLLTGAMAVSAPAKDKPKEIVHQVEVYHPGRADIHGVTQELVELQDATGHPVEFYMDVRSVICLDTKCKIVPVRLFWDHLGFYKRYELARGVKLEKAEGKLFTRDDYRKLHQVLQQENSPLKQLKLEDLVAEGNEQLVVDAIAGATILIDEGAVVEGAAWTCYTLWHWVYGDVVKIIRQITGDANSLEELRTFLNEGDEDHQVFALEQLLARGAYDSQTADAVIDLASGASQQLSKQLLKYVEQAPSVLYYDAMGRLFNNGDDKQRIMYLNSLLETENIPPPGFYDKFSQQLCHLNSYQEVNILLNIFENKKLSSTEIIKQALCLLDHDKFLIARRAYWFLESQDLPAAAHERVELFERNYSDKL